jgi:hypothetical protein
MISVSDGARSVLEQAWRDPGFCVPNHDVYPHQWLWDSCFHAIAWSSVGSERGLTELGNALSAQAADGFVPHMIYWHTPDLHAEFWGMRRTTPLTQPPMFGHAAAELQRRGQAVPAELVDRARAGLEHLARRARTPAGLVPVFHPWETGCDDSPRWDSWFADGGPEHGWEVDRSARRSTKQDLVDALHRSADGHGLSSDVFAVGSIGFNALVAWNARELADAFPDSCGPLADLAAEIAAAVSARWDGFTWVDDPGLVDGRPADEGWADEHLADRPESRVRTLDTMLALLVDPRAEQFAELVDPAGFGAPLGPRGVDRREPSYRPDRYWRGSTWPHLVYLLVQAADRFAETAPPGLAAQLSAQLVEGAQRSGWAEYWHPDTGEGFGARPQTWAALAAAVVHEP